MKKIANAVIVAFALVAVPLCAAPATAADSFFDIFTELSVIAPPYPSSDVVTVVGNNFGGSFHATHECWSSLMSTHLGPLSNVPCMIKGGGGGGGGFPPGIDSFFDVYYQVELPNPTPGQWNRRISDVRIVHPPGTPPGTWRLVPLHPGAPPGSIESFFDVFTELSFFDITYRMACDDGEHTFHIHCDSPSGRMSFFDVFLELGNPVPDAQGHYDSFFDVFVDIQLSGPMNPALPDARCRTTGNFAGGPTPTAATSWGRIKSLYR